MTLTPLHLALGLSESAELSFELVQQACDLGVQERDDLDWKSTLPLNVPAENGAGRDAQQEELAKDIAAMANSRGGMIVYGVAEVRGTNAASHVQSVGEPAEATLQNIRRVASNMVYPPVTTLALRWLVSGDSKVVVLALEIAPSVEAPHLIRPRRQPSGAGFWFAVPFRNGPDTDWMPEKMIESAYRDRLANRRQRDEDLGYLHRELVSRVAHLAGGAWIVGIARPENPLPARPRLDADQAAVIFKRAWQMQWSVNLHAAISATRVLRDIPVRRGLRRFSQLGYNHVRALGDSRATIRVIAEVHFDGSVGMALTRGGAFGRNEVRDERALGTSDLDQAVLDLFSLARQAAQELHVPGNYEARLTVEPEVTLFRRPEPHLMGEFQKFSEEDRIGPFQPVTGTFLMAEGAESMMASLVDFAEDAVNQTRTGSLLDPLRPQ